MRILETLRTAAPGAIEVADRDRLVPGPQDLLVRVRMVNPQAGVRPAGKVVVFGAGPTGPGTRPEPPTPPDLAAAPAAPAGR
jgi:hypothetical protein